MCNNGCNYSNCCGCNCGCNCGCGCNQNSLWNILFGNTQRVCRDCCGNLVVTSNRDFCPYNNRSACGCLYNNRSGCAVNTAEATPVNGNAFTCVSFCQNTDNAQAYNGNGGCGLAGYSRCGCNAYSAWTQENYGE